MHLHFSWAALILLIEGHTLIVDRCLCDHLLNHFVDIYHYCYTNSFNRLIEGGDTGRDYNLNNAFWLLYARRDSTGWIQCFSCYHLLCLLIIIIIIIAMSKVSSKFIAHKGYVILFVLFFIN